MLAALVVVLVVGAQPEVVELDNGMRWLLVPRADQGWVAGAVAVAAGGAHEHEGQTGAAHLLEHLAFAGTPMLGSPLGWRVEAPAMERVEALLRARAALGQAPAHDPRAMLLETELVQAEQRWRETSEVSALLALMSEHDVGVNANTSKDRTVYFGEFAREKLELWLSVEAQRFAAPVFREFRSEREVVIQELRDRQSDLQRASEALWAMAFEGTGYAWSTIGREQDLLAMHPGVLDAFYVTHYVPSNAVGVLVGEFEPAEARRLLARTFALLPRRPAPAPLSDAARPQARERVVKSASPLLLLGFPRPADFAAEAASWEVAELALLNAGPTGPLARLAQEGLVAQSVLSRGPGVAQAHLQTFSLVLPRGGEAPRVRARLFELLSAWEPDEAEIASARVALELSRRRTIRSRRTLAESLAEELLYTRGWQSLLSSKYATVTRADVLRVLRSWSPERAFVVEGRP
ncbi:MAG: M16 family metallopeptidase [Myxococcota bacterium]